MKRPYLMPLVPLYRAGVGWKNARFDRGVGVERLQWPVVSVGSLSAGGAGKTPVVAALVSLLRDAGYAVDILSRGYGRTSTETLRVDMHGDALMFGDESLMLARATNVPVFVGTSRAEAGRLAEKELQDAARHVHLLDDGFQHRQLHRDLDVVLLTKEDVLDELLPAGNLREPYISLKRASAVVLREEEVSEVEPFVRRLTGAPVWVVRRQIALSADVERPLLFCGVARPENVLEMVAAHVTPVRTKYFADHHRYTQADVELLLQLAREKKADGFVTTAKDFVKLSDGWRAQMEQVGPIVVAELRVIFDKPDVVVQQIAAKVNAR